MGLDKPRGHAFEDFWDPIIEDVGIRVDRYVIMPTISPSLSN
jgi:hypothetical protein